MGRGARDPIKKGARKRLFLEEEINESAISPLEPSV